MLDEKTIEELAVKTKKDEVLTLLVECIRSGKSIKPHKPLNKFKFIFKELSVNEHSIILRNDLIVMPYSLRKRAIEYAHEGHLGIVLCKGLLRTRCWWPNMNSMVNEKIRDCAACQANVDTTSHALLIPTSFPASRMD